MNGARDADRRRGRRLPDAAGAAADDDLLRRGRADRRTSSCRADRAPRRAVGCSCDALHGHERRHLFGETRPVEPHVLDGDDRHLRPRAGAARAKRARDRCAPWCARRASDRAPRASRGRASRSSSLNGSNGTRFTITWASGMSCCVMPLASSSASLTGSVSGRVTTMAPVRSLSVRRSSPSRTAAAMGPLGITRRSDAGICARASAWPVAGRSTMIISCSSEPSLRFMRTRSRSL